MLYLFTVCNQSCLSLLYSPQCCIAFMTFNFNDYTWTLPGSVEKTVDLTPWVIFHFVACPLIQTRTEVIVVEHDYCGCPDRGQRPKLPLPVVSFATCASDLCASLMDRLFITQVHPDADPDYFMFSSNLFEVAERGNCYKSGSGYPLNFTKAFSKRLNDVPHYPYSTRRMWYVLACGMH